MNKKKGVSGQAQGERKRKGRRLQQCEDAGPRRRKKGRHARGWGRRWSTARSPCTHARYRTCQRKTDNTATLPSLLALSYTYTSSPQQAQRKQQSPWHHHQTRRATTKERHTHTRTHKYATTRREGGREALIVVAVRLCTQGNSRARESEREDRTSACSGVVGAACGVT